MNPVRGNPPFPDVRPRNPEHLEIGIDLPAVEVADQPHRRRMRSPFAETPLFAFAFMKSVIVVGVRPVGERALSLRQLLRAIGRTLGASANRRLKGPEIGIV